MVFRRLEFVRETALWNVFSEAYYCAVIGFTFNHAGFLVEILRGAFQSVPKGVREAAHVDLRSRDISPSSG